jgi:nucleotide-binding universal stress UspA family protein
VDELISDRIVTSCILSSLYDKNKKRKKNGEKPMFEKVLFPTDFSEYAGKTLECAGDIPGVKEIVLLHIVDATHPSKMGWVHGPHIENARILLEEKKEALEKRGLKVRTRVDVIRSGEVFKAITDTAEAEEVSLIIIGARGKNALENILLGSVSANVVRHAGMPVLVMRFKREEGPGGKTFEKYCQLLFSKVLVPTDFSEPAGNVIPLLKKIPLIKEIVLLNVVDKGESEEEVRRNVQAARIKNENIKNDLAQLGYLVTTRVHAGYPPDDIVATAENEDVSLIIMSPHGEGWLRELKALFIGSTTSAVVRRAFRPVLIIKDRSSGTA